MTLYEAAAKRLPASDIDHHESDLYLRKTPESVALVNAWIAETGFKASVSTFRCQIDGAIWFDIAFAYDPAWIERAERSAQNA